MRRWVPLLILASAQFVMVLDTSVMNVAISEVVDDLDTTIQGVQTAITMYTLVMAAFMLLGAKLGDVLGRNRAFAVGLIVYGVGSLTTALSPDLAVLLVGWSGVEGFGAVLVIPAIAALTAATYEGRERALAYALLGGTTAIAVAAGPLIGGTEITPLGFSPVPFVVLAGLGLLWAFVAWEGRRTRRGEDELVDPRLLRITHLRAGLSTLLGQQLVLLGTFFVVPVYLQVVVGLNAFDTGKRLLPMSLAMLVFALLGPRVAGRRSPRTVARFGLLLLSVGAIVMLATLEVTLDVWGFRVALLLMGAGAGLLASQLGNVIMSAVESHQTSEAGGLQGTAQNLGSSLGTAIIGAVLLASLSNGFGERIEGNPSIPAAAQRQIAAKAEAGIDIVPLSQVERAAEQGGLSPAQARAVADDYSAAELDALRLALGGVALAALLSLWATRRLPTSSPAGDGTPSSV